MKKCPKCEGFMSFHIIYNNGYPVVDDYCTCCGYRPLEEETYTTDDRTRVENIPSYGTKVNKDS